MEALKILPYIGIGTLIVLFAIFEVKYKQGENVSCNTGYTYYTPNSNVVRIRHIFGSHYKVYVNGDCPTNVKRDRFGNYFTLNARSALDVEFQIDELYRHF